MIIKGQIGPMHAKDIRWGAFVRAGEPCDWYPQRMTWGELVAFVMAAANGELYLAQQVQPVEEIGLVWPAQSFLIDVSEDARKQIGTCYERLDLSVGRTRGGQPTFPSVQFVHVEDWKIARDMIAAEIVRRERLAS